MVDTDLVNAVVGAKVTVTSTRMLGQVTVT
jgi:hypothetical protein